MFHSIYFFLLFALSTSLAAVDNPCTTVKFPRNAQPRGKQVLVKPIVLRPGVTEYMLHLENNCRRTNALIVRVCDYDKRPSVYPVSFAEVEVIRNGQSRDVGMAFAEYYCDY